MARFEIANYPELLGITDVCRVTDQEIWRSLVSPITRGLLGPIVEKRDPRVMETADGLFPGDQASNLNDHRLYGGQRGFVRYPYVHSFYRTREGAFIVKRDGSKFEVFCWFGDVEAGRGEMILKAALRDRRFDGTSRANDCALLDYPYDDPVLNRPLSKELKSVELSIYAYMPGSSLFDSTGDRDYEDFVRQPYGFLDRPELFMKHFEMAWRSKRAPGQSAVPIPDVARHSLKGFYALAERYGYDLIEMAPSHYHVARWGLAGGYRFADPTQAATFDGFTRGLERIRKSGMPLTRSQQSWVCVIQNLMPEALIPEHLNLGGPRWPQDNISKQVLWLYRTVSERAAGFVPEPILPLSVKAVTDDGGEACA